MPREFADNHRQEVAREAPLHHGSRSWAERVIPAIGLMAAAVAGLMPTRTVAQPVITEFPVPTAGNRYTCVTPGPCRAAAADTVSKHRRPGSE